MENCIVLISHSDYLYNLGGTEKFIGEVIDNFRNNGISSIHIFPINNITSKFNIRKIGVNHNGKFIGVYSEDEFINVICNITDINNYLLNNIQIHHLYGWERVLLAKKLKTLNIPIKFFVHDFQLIKSTSITGNIDNNDNIKKTNIFFEIIKNQLVNIIVPSKFTKDKWLSYFSDHKNFIEVREHLVSKGKYTKKKWNNPLRIAYVGSFVEHKGSNEWLKLMKEFSNDNLEFYYFGESKVKIDNLIYRKVKFRKEQDMTMQEMLRRDNIDIVFLWSKLPETYSYTFFESLASGALIITNNISGNIAKMVSEYKCGFVLATIQECIVLLKNKEFITNSIKNYINVNMSPSEIYINKDIDQLICSNKKSRRLNYIKVNKISKDKLLTWIYITLKKLKILTN